MTETYVERIAGEPLLTVYTSERKYINKLHALASESPETVTIQHENPDGSLVARIPMDWFVFPKPPTKRNLTEEQRAACAERLKRVNSLTHDK